MKPVALPPRITTAKVYDMGTSAKPRKKYRPRPVLRDPLGYVMDSVTYLNTNNFPLVDLKIKNSAAMFALLRGTAKKHDINKLIAMCNITEALWEMGFGKEYKDVFVDGKYAILSIVNRAGKCNKFVPTGPEITMLNTLMELHDAQLDVITVKDMEKAIRTVETRIKHKHKVVTLPPVPEELK